MDDNDIRLIRESFAHLHRRKTETAALFYGRLFEIAPQVRPLFKNDLTILGEKLMETLFVAIATLNDREGLTVLLRKLGRGHKRYGVENSHYESVGAALIWTFKTSLGPRFTPEVERAWTELYGEIADIMMEAASQAGSA